LNNPGLRTLVSFLEQIQRNAPVNFTTLSEERRRGYGMVSRYLKFCLRERLIKITSIRRTRGRYPSKTYSLTEKGSKLLGVFEDKGS
jgi:DNA-binding PadR family transcriptional regulator